MKGIINTAKKLGKGYVNLYKRSNKFGKAAIIGTTLLFCLPSLTQLASQEFQPIAKQETKQEVVEPMKSEPSDDELLRQAQISFTVLMQRDPAGKELDKQWRSMGAIRTVNMNAAIIDGCENQSSRYSEFVSGIDCDVVVPIAKENLLP